MTKYKSIKVNGIKYDEHRYIMEKHQSINNIINNKTYKYRELA